MREFKYDVIQLIQGVQHRPCLWDKSIENYKDRVERRMAWEEIFCILDERYEEMTPEEKRVMGELILNKWTNIRDTFVKTLKTKMGRPKKKYVLHDHLKFLSKITPGDESNMEYADDDVPVAYMKQEFEGEKEATSYNHRKKFKKTYVEENTNDYDSAFNTYTHGKRSKQSDFSVEANSSLVETNSSKRKKKDIFTESSKIEDDIDFVEVEETSDPRLMNEDEAFFASLLPSIVKYNEDERLEFRMEVLGVMKRIKDKKKWTVDD